MKVLHVLNYAWPWIDGYTARSIGLVGAQADRLEGVEPLVATSPFTPLAQGADETFRTGNWGPELQLRAGRSRAGAPLGPRPWERPAVGFSPVTSAAFRDELESIARRSDAELIHVHHPHYVAAAALDVAAKLGLPAVFEVRCFNGYYDLGTGSPVRSARGHWQNRLEFALARKASAAVTIGDGLASILRGAGVAADRLFVVRNSVDTERFHADGSREPYPRRLERAARHAGAGPRTDDDRASRVELRVGYATTFERIENLDEAVRAATLAAPVLAAEGIELKLVVAGTGRDWPRIRALVDELGANGTVELPGLVPYAAMPDFYRSLDLFLVPRGAHAVSMDTTPLKPLEALACGLPLVVTSLPAMRELLQGRDDVRFTATDARAMSEAIVDFARSPFAGRGEIAGRAWHHEVRRYHEVYARAREHGPPRAARGRATGRRLSARARGSLAALGRVVGPLRGLGRDLERGFERDASPAPDRGREGGRVHVVVCGFARSGSTVLQLMLESCVPRLRGFEGEVEAMDALGARAPAGRLVTKYPDDVLRVDAIASAVAAAGGDALFLLKQRDPRDVLTSRHGAYSAGRGYYMTPERFAATFEAFLAARERDDALVVRYEDLVSRPEEVEAAIVARTGWATDRRFAEWHVAARERSTDSMTEGALGGLRPLERDGVERWRDPAHAERLSHLVATCPTLVRACVELGYEDDDAWADAYHG